ncbi:unnamed protein product [Spodoptera exigua]|nr:unnamed protein product [Spodoptera exigua]
MLRIVHGPYKAIILLVLCSGICGLKININGVNDIIQRDNLDILSPQLAEPSIEDENELEVAAENENGLFITTVEDFRNQNEGSVEKTLNGAADDVIKRQRRQAAHGYSPLYPQLPSGPPYNYQQQPGYNPYTTQPNQLQPGYNPYAPNANQHPSYNSSSVNPYQRPSQWNPNSYNSSRPGTSYNPTPSPYNPSGQNPYNPHSNYPFSNTSTAGYPYKPPYGQHPFQNQTFNSSPYPGGYRPPNSTYSTPIPSYNNRPGQNVYNSSYPGQSPYNNNYPSYGNMHPVQPFNATGQRPPYSSPGQYPPYNSNNSSPLPMQPNGSPYGQSPYNNSNYNPYNPSAPNYPQNQGQNNFFYPQNNTAYDPRRVPPQNFSYH